MMPDGLTTVIAAFFLFCLYRQDMIKNRTYYYVTFACLLGLILFTTLFYFLNDTYGRGFCAIMMGLLQAGALVMTMAYVGGMSLKQIGSQVMEAANDVRTSGEAKKPIIVPLTGAKPAPKDAYEEEEREQREKPRIVIELPKKGDDKGSLPID